MRFRRLWSSDSCSYESTKLFKQKKLTFLGFGSDVAQVNLSLTDYFSYIRY